MPHLQNIPAWVGQPVTGYHVINLHKIHNGAGISLRMFLHPFSSQTKGYTLDIWNSIVEQRIMGGIERVPWNYNV